ncbi:MAG TPA: hypothetical protein VGL35_07170 [Rhizomicrobium sp.]
MKHLGKLAIGAAMLAGTAIATTAPATAGVSVHVGIGVPVPAPYVAAPPCAYGPASCGYYSYSEPVFVGGAWVYGPHYYRYSGGRPWVWWHGGWHTGFRGGWHGGMHRGSRERWHR